MPTEGRFSLVGDCHAARIGRIARARGLRFYGGPLGNGRALEGPFFDLRDGAFVLREPPPSNPDVADLLRHDVPMLSTLGFNTDRIARRLYRSHHEVQDLDATALSDAVIRQVVLDFKPGTLAFYRAAADHGLAVHAVRSPQRFLDAWFDLALRLEDALVALLEELGVTFVDVRGETTDRQGRLRPEYFSEREDDDTHANDAWAGLVLDRFLADAGLGTVAALG